ERGSPPLCDEAPLLASQRHARTPPEQAFVSRHLADASTHTELSQAPTGVVTLLADVLGRSAADGTDRGTGKTGLRSGDCSASLEASAEWPGTDARWRAPLSRLGGRPRPGARTE